MMCHFSLKAGVVSSPIFPGLKFEINKEGLIACGRLSKAMR
jgi:hypothetical protein